MQGSGKTRIPNFHLTSPEPASRVLPHHRMRSRLVAGSIKKPYQTFPNTAIPLCPPNPKVLLMATLIFLSMASPVTILMLDGI